jgi:hypothetical protein
MIPERSDNPSEAVRRGTQRQIKRPHLRIRQGQRFLLIDRNSIMLTESMAALMNTNKRRHRGCCGHKDWSDATLLSHETTAPTWLSTKSAMRAGSYINSSRYSLEFSCQSGEAASAAFQGRGKHDQFNESRLERIGRARIDLRPRFGRF